MPHSPPATTASTQGTEFTLLIDRIRAGDERALEKLLKAVSVPLRQKAHKLIGSSLRSHIDAEDLVQSVSLILWRGLRAGKFEFDSPRHLMALASVLLKRQAAKTVERLKHSLSVTLTGDMKITLADEPITVASVVVQKAEREDQIRHYMKRVSPEDREMLELLLLGHSIAAAARHLRVEPSALRMRLSRLRVRLRKIHPGEAAESNSTRTTNARRK